MAGINEVLRSQRMKLGLDEAEVARRSGLSLDEYRDVEQHDDEAFQVLHLGNLRLLCGVLGLDPLDLLGITCAFCSGPSAGSVPGGGRHEVVRSRRVALGLSQADLAERIGFEAGVVGDIERDPDYLEGWSAELVLALAQVLGVAPQVLLNFTCRRCRR
jgi:transcriptional regulator with XRE-family HTH domain